MGEAERRNANINGVINVGYDSGINLQAYKDALITYYEKTPDPHGKTYTVEFSEETKKTDTEEHYVNYWIY